MSGWCFQSEPTAAQKKKPVEAGFFVKSDVDHWASATKLNPTVKLS